MLREPHIELVLDLIDFYPELSEPPLVLRAAAQEGAPVGRFLQALLCLESLGFLQLALFLGVCTLDMKGLMCTHSLRTA